MGEIDGRVRAETSGGGISLERSTGEAYIHTSGGGIRLGEIGGSLDAKTSGGSISVDGVNGDLKARSSGGGLQLRKHKRQPYSQDLGRLDSGRIAQADR